MIASEQDQLRKELYRSDDEFNPDRDLPHGPAFFQQSARSRDEVVIDELLASAPRNQGYYLKLHKESPIMPGQWEFKMKIDNYEGWVDLEAEIQRLVVASTKRFGPKKWGSGVYKVSVWNEGGIRQQKSYPVNQFAIDAGETDEVLQAHTRVDNVVDPQEYVNTQMDTAKKMFDAMSSVMPKAQDPNQQMAALVQAWQQGKGEKAQSENQMTQLMVGLMTALMQMIPTLVSGNRNPNQPNESPAAMMAQFMELLKNGKDFLGLGNNADNTLAGQMAQLKALGIDPFKREDTLDTIAKVKMIMQSASEMQGGGKVPVERPDMFEKLVDALAPHVPKMISDFREVTANATKAQAMQLAQREQAMRAGQIQTPVEERPRTAYGAPVGPQPGRMGAGDAFSERPDMDPYSGYEHRPGPDPMAQHPEADMASFQRGGPAPSVNPNQAGQSPQVDSTPPLETEVASMHPLLKELYYVTRKNDRNAYPALYETVQQIPGAGEIIQATLEGTASVDQLIMMIQNSGFGGQPYTYPPFVRQLQSYLGGFVEWIQQNVQPHQLKAECNKCGQIYWYDSLDKYNAEPDHRCGNQVSPTEDCDGQVRIIYDSDEGQAKAQA